MISNGFNAGSEVTQTQMTVAYETVFIVEDPGEDSPAGFGTIHYDSHQVPYH